MTPEEIAANSSAIQAALVGLGITPEMALHAEGLERARQRFESARQTAETAGNTNRVGAIDARIERDATTHARREMARFLRRATAGDTSAAPPGSPPPPPDFAPGFIPDNLNALLQERQGAGNTAEPLMPPRDPPPPEPISPDMLSRVPPPPNALMPQTPEEQAAQDRNNRLGNMAFEMSGIGPARRSGLAFSQGDILGGLGNAGMAMMPYRPLLGLGTMGATLGGAVAADLGLGDMFRTPRANAQQQRQPPASEPMSRSDYFREHGTRRGSLQDAVAAAERSVRESQAYRNVVEDNPRRAQAMIDSAVRTARTTFERENTPANIEAEERRLDTAYNSYLASFNQQRDRGRAFARAEEARDRELARDRRFADTYTGRAFDLFGGYAPGVAGGITGLLTRSARGALGWGAAAGLGSAHVPLGYESLFSPVDNPRRRALEEYAAALPENEPERARAIRDLQDLNRYPVNNPVRREATEQLYDLGGLLKRSGLGLAEGALGGHIGRALPGIPDRIMNWWASRQNRLSPGSSSPTGPNAGPSNPPPPNPNPVQPPNPPPPNPNPNPNIPPPPPPPPMPILPPHLGGPSHQPGVTQYRNPATGEVRSLDRAGRWQGPRRGGGHGWTSEPPASWERISAADQPRNALLG